MLEIELSECGYDVCRKSASGKLPEADVYVISSDFLGIKHIICDMIPPRTPIIICGKKRARGEELSDAQRITFFEIPFLVEDFIAYAEKLLGADTELGASDKQERAVSFTLRGSRCGCVLDGEFVSLSGKEYDLLAYLYSRAGKPVSRDELLSAVWPKKPENDTNVVDVYISYLRKKIDIRFGTRFIKTVRNKGYTFDIGA